MSLEKLKQELKGKLVTFRRQKYMSSLATIKEDLVVTTRDILVSQIEKSVRSGYLVIVDGVAYETENRRKFKFSNFEKYNQGKEEIKNFPWEIKEGG